MGFKVFEWEQNTIDLMSQAPRSGALFDFMYFISDFSTTKWIVLIVILGLLLRLGWKKISHPLVLSIVAAGLGDLVSRRIFKEFIMRPRPDYLNQACDTSACWGFISSHAANVFAVLAVLYLYDKRTLRWSLPLACLVAFSRVYLIDHYPLDVIGGAIVGLLIGGLVWIASQTLKKWSETRKSHFPPIEVSTLTKHSIFVGTFALAFTILSIAYSDQAIAEAFSKPELQSFRSASRELTNIALSGFYFGLAAIAYIASRWILPRFNWFKNKSNLLLKMRLAGAFSFSVLFISGLIILIMKIGFGRQRPHLSETFDSSQFEPFNFHWYWHSFPSGHAQVAFVVGTLLSIARPQYRFLFLSGSLFIAFTRVATHQHYLSDIILGGAIGYLITLWLYSRSKFVLELSSQTLVCSNIALLSTIQSVISNYPKNSLRAQIDPQNGFIKIISKTANLLTSSERMIAQISPSVECVILGGNPAN